VIRPKARPVDCANFQLLERICGVDLTQVVGLNVMSVLLIVSEIGVDMSKWRSATIRVWGYSTAARKPISGLPKRRRLPPRKLACIVYHLLKYKDQYREPDPAIYQLKLHNATLGKLQKQAKQAAVIGYQLVPSALPRVTLTLVRQRCSSRDSFES
jgi:hypothetical protein